MDLSKMNIMFGCYYCKKSFGINKDKLKEHWKDGCKRMSACYTSQMSVKMSDSLSYCVAYVNQVNIDIDVKESVIPLISWPQLVFQFSSKNNWKKIKHNKFHLPDTSDED